MKLTLQIKLLPSDEQFLSLKNTLIEANLACNYISEIAFNDKIFNQFKLHKQTYHSVKEKFNLSAQMVIRCISKVTDSYKVDKKVQRNFRPLGAITYDARILTFAKDGISLWSVDGRLKGVKFVCYNKNYIPYIKGEADLVLKKGKFYLFQTVEVPEEDVTDIEDFIGVDFGQTDIAVLSDGTNYNSEELKKVRKKYSKVRASVQSKGTKSARRLLKRLSGRERRFVSINNHAIAKKIVAKAKAENKGIAVENLTNIRKTAKPRNKQQKTELNRWSFYQLREFLTYKSALGGVKFVVIPAPYTSQTCSICNHIGDRNGKRFRCEHCGNKADADFNAALNIAAWGVTVNTPEKSTMFCSLHN